MGQSYLTHSKFSNHNMESDSESQFINSLLALSSLQERTSSTLDVTDKLYNSTAELKESKTLDDFLFPDELNKFLREQIQYYVHENGMLKKNLSDIETQYNKCNERTAELTKKLGEYENVIEKNGLVTSTHVAGTRLVELTKKLREKMSEVEVLKTRCSRVERQLFDLENVDRGDACPKVEEGERPTEQLEAELKKLQDKFNCTMSKLSEARNSNLKLKNELKLANKLLQQEVGDSFESLLSLNSSTSNWRGRSQTICDLQQKNNELREKLRVVQQKLGPDTMPSIVSKADSKNSVLAKENDCLKSKYDELKKKHEALKARCKVLDTELTLSKSKLSMLKEQADRDQDIISTLTAQISSYRNTSSDVVQEKDRLMKTILTEKGDLSNQIKEYRGLVKSMTDELDNKKKEIEELKAGGCGKKASPVYTEHFKEDNQRLLTLIETQNERLKAERDSHAKTQAMLKAEMQRATRAEATAIRAEIGSNKSGNYSSSTPFLKAMDPSLRDRLELAEENVKALKTRLEIEQMERRADLQEFSNILQTSQNK